MSPRRSPGRTGRSGRRGSEPVEADGTPVAALLSVRRAPWDAAPDGPFVIESFTDSAWRRRGFARLLRDRCTEAAARARESCVGRRVAEANTPARALYAVTGLCALPASPQGLSRIPATGKRANVSR